MQMTRTELEIRFFDPGVEAGIVTRRLPHWSQTGTLAFLTWRTWDSIPADVASELLQTRADWLSRHGIDVDIPDWRDRLRALSPGEQHEFHHSYSDRWQHILDECRGTCVLRDPALARVVADSLRYFDGDRYLVTDFVVMPNHVHVLAVFATEDAMLKQCEGWKHFTATQLNKRLGRSGRFWQVDGFDHLVRSESQFDALRRYIARNPSRAGLIDGEFMLFAADPPTSGENAGVLEPAIPPSVLARDTCSERPA